MKISPIASFGNTIGAITTGLDPQVQRVENLRSLKMTTMATPLQPQVETPAGDASATELTIPDTNDQATATIEDTKPLSPQFAALAKQRRALQVKERELVDREKALSNPSDRIDVARLKSEPLRVLLEAGVTYDQLTEAILANQSGVTPEINALKAEIKALKEGVDKNFTDRDTQAEQQVLAEMRRDATRLAAEGDTYEMVRETKSIPVVMKLIEKTYRDKGEVLEISEALQLVEDTLMEDSLKLANLKKVQNKLAPPAPPAQAPQQQRQMRTLTNRDTATPPMTPKQRAIAVFQGTLKR